MIEICDPLATSHTQPEPKCPVPSAMKRDLSAPIFPKSDVTAPGSRPPGDEACALMLSQKKPWFQAWAALRSEEHTSELQSLMSISYAVFCLKKKTRQDTK